MIKVMILVAIMASSAEAVTNFVVKAKDSQAPGQSFEAYLEVTSDQLGVAAVGARLAYDATRLSLSNAVPGPDVPGGWSFVYSGIAPGLVDLVITDTSILAEVINAPNGANVLTISFDRLDQDCLPADFGFNSAAPLPGAEQAAFPDNQYVLTINGSIGTDVATTAISTGPFVDDRTFIRGNLADRGAHTVNILDVVALLGALFNSAFNLGFDCQAALDVNNSGSSNIIDVVSLVQGLFNPAAPPIAPPNGAPGLGSADGGSIPSVLSCV